jgi:hypothetical protein
MSIRQFTSAYLVHEDRLLFRVTTIDDSEYRFWLTRRVTLFILGSAQFFLNRHLEGQYSPQAAKAVVSFGKEALQEKIFNTSTAESSNTNEVYQPGSQYPIGSDPVLVLDVQCNYLKDEELAIFSYDFLLPGGGKSNLKLTSELLQAMCALLDKLRDGASWELPSMNFENSEDKNGEDPAPLKSNPHLH